MGRGGGGWGGRKHGGPHNGRWTRLSLPPKTMCRSRGSGRCAGQARLGTARGWGEEVMHAAVRVTAWEGRFVRAPTRQPGPRGGQGRVSFTPLTGIGAWGREPLHDPVSYARPPGHGMGREAAARPHRHRQVPSLQACTPVRIVRGEERRQMVHNSSARAPLCRTDWSLAFPHVLFLLACLWGRRAVHGGRLQGGLARKHLAGGPASPAALVAGRPSRRAEVRP